MVTLLGAGKNVAITDELKYEIAILYKKFNSCSQALAVSTYLHNMSLCDTPNAPS